jgi:hypothetical protein
MLRIDPKAAKAPGIMIPLSFLLRVDQVNKRLNVTHSERLSWNSPLSAVTWIVVRPLLGKSNHRSGLLTKPGEVQTGQNLPFKPNL